TLIGERVEKIKQAHPEKGNMAIPVDLVTCSGSGLDPGISVLAANYQLERVAKNNNLSVDEVKKIVEECTNHKFLGVFGEETVNVLEVNLKLDAK
ncbi:MAG: potassium-transporting ATPase subunit C, partial [Oscillospiraceae bacterium]